MIKIMIFTKKDNVKELTHKVKSYFTEDCVNNCSKVYGYVKTNDKTIEIMNVSNNLERYRGCKAQAILYDEGIPRKYIEEFFNIMAVSKFDESKEEWRDDETLIAPIGMLGYLLNPNVVFLVTGGRREGKENVTVITHDFLKAYSYTKAILGMITCSKCDEVNGVLWQSHIMSDCSYTQEQFINMISRTGDDV